MISNLESEIEFTKQGLKVWKEIFNQKDIKNYDKVILIFQNLSGTNDFIKSFLTTSALINNPPFFVISEDKEVNDVQKILMDNYAEKLIILKEAECLSILNLYNLYMFTDQLFILSPNMPIGRTGYNLVRNGLLTEDEYMKIALLNNI